MSEINVGIRVSNAGVDVGGITKTNDELNKLNATQTKLQTQNAQMAQSANSVKTSVQAETDQFAALDSQVTKLLSSLDPVYNKTRQLDAANETLFQGLRAGIVSQKQYEDALGQLATKYEESATAADHSAFSTAGAKRELIVLGHEALTGNFSRMPGSFLVLAERIDITSALFSPLILGIGAAAAAALVMAKAFADGEAEMQAMNNAIKVTNDYAGITVSSLHQLAEQVSQSGTLTISTSKQIVTELVASGRIGAQSLTEIAKLAGDFAAATGKDVAKIAPELVKLFDDPSKGAAELNKQMHFLNTTDIEYIDHLVRIGDEEEARLVLSQKLDAFLPKQADNLGVLEKAWNSLSKAASSAWDSMLGIGKEQTVDQKIADIEAKLSAKVGRGGQYAVPREAGQTEHTRAGDIYFQSEYESLTKQLEVLKQQKTAQDEVATAAGKAASENEKHNKFLQEINKSTSAHILQLRDELTLVQSEKPANQQESVNQQQRILEIKKEIANLEKKEKPKTDPAVKQEQSYYARTSDDLIKHIQTLAQENDQTQKLTESQKLKIKIDADLAAGIGKLNATDKQRVDTLLSTLAAQEAYQKQQTDLRAISDQSQKEAQADREVLIKKQDAFQSYSDKLRQENEDLNASLIVDDRARAQAQIELEHSRSLDRINLLNLEADQAQALIDAETEHYNLEQKKIEQNSKTNKNLSKELGLTFTSAFENAVIGGKKFSDILASVGQDIERVILRITVIEPLLNAIKSSLNDSGVGDWLNGLLGGSSGSSGYSALPDTSANYYSASANGNVFSGGELQKFASGGAFTNSVVSSPTMFPMGLMGEAGPEAILPLSRGADGKLGVQASGGGAAGGVNVQVNLVETADTSKQGKVETNNSANGTKSITVFIESIIDNKINNDIGRGRGVAGVFEQTYGLNRAAGARG